MHLLDQRPGQQLPWQENGVVAVGVDLPAHEEDERAAALHVSAQLVGDSRLDGRDIGEDDGFVIREYAIAQFQVADDFRPDIAVCPAGRERVARLLRRCEGQTQEGC